MRPARPPRPGVTPRTNIDGLVPARRRPRIITAAGPSASRPYGRGLHESRYVSRRSSCLYPHPVRPFPAALDLAERLVEVAAVAVVEPLEVSVGHRRRVYERGPRWVPSSRSAGPWSRSFGWTAHP